MHHPGGSSDGWYDNEWAVMSMIEVSPAALAVHPFLHGMPRDQLAMLAEAASDVTFGVRYRIFEDGGHAARFWLIQSGHVAVDLHVPGEGLVVIETIGMGELLGWSWLFAPFKWAFGAVAASPVEAFEFDAPAVRARCASDPELGHELHQRVSRVLAKRLQATRVRLIAGAGYSVTVP
jgi:CRP/FNR family transcriptional regulator, cyclic AMP receptor protein